MYCTNIVQYLLFSAWLLKNGVSTQNGVFMQKIIISLICCLLPTFAFADAVKIHHNAPDSHIVVKGDTLWDISAKFFEDPWKWPKFGA